MKILLLTCVAGFFGTLLRYGCVRGINHLLPGFPWGTLFVNVTGAFLAGFLYVYCRVRFAAYEEYYPLIFLGFLGAFTTFSSFALESYRMLADTRYWAFAGNMLLQNGTGLLAVWAGFRTAGHFF